MTDQPTAQASQPSNNGPDGMARLFAGRRFNYKITAGGTSAFGLMMVLFVLCWYMSDNAPDRVLSYTLLITGIALGWLVAVLATPYGELEETRFVGYRQAISAFVGGYLVSKIDNSLTQALSWDTLKQPLAAFRVAAFAAGFLLAMLFTYIFRVYAKLLRIRQKTGQDEASAAAPVYNQTSIDPITSK